MVDHSDYDAIVTLNVAKCLDPNRRDFSPRLHRGSDDVVSNCLWLTARPPLVYAVREGYLLQKAT